MNATSMILKADSRGRVRTPPERREALLAEFARSGVSATKFCAMVGVRYQTFATWLQKRRGGGHPKSIAQSTPPCFVEAVRQAPLVAGITGCPALRLHLSCGLRLELAQSSQVALAVELIRALGDQSC